MDRRQLAWLFASCVLAGCGGGGSGSATPSPVPPPDAPPPPSPPPPPPGLAPFEVTTFDPPDGIVDRVTAFRALFSGPVDARSVDPSRNRLIGPLGHAITCRWAVSGSIVQATPLDTLPAATRVTFAIDSRIRDINGRLLGADASARVVTQAAAWVTRAIDVGSMPSHTAGTRPHLATWPLGDAMAAWSDAALHSPSIYAAQRDGRTGAWSAPQVVRASATAGARVQGLVASPNGDAMLFWTESPSGYVQLTGAMKQAGATTWQSPATVPAAPVDQDVLGSVCAVDAQGWVTVVTSATGGLFASRRDPADGRWSDPTRIDASPVPPYTLALNSASGLAGEVVAAWIQDGGNGRDIFVTRYDPTAGSWQTPERAGGGAGQYMTMGVDQLGNITLAWVSPSTIMVPPMMFATRGSVSQLGWTVRARLDQDSLFGAGAPSLAVDAAGFATVAWLQEGTPRAARFDPRGDAGWGTATQVDSTYVPGAEVPALVADAAGNVTLVIVEAQNQPTAFRYSATQDRWGLDAAIGTPALGSAVFANQPAVAIDAGGNAIAAWFAWNDVAGVSNYVVSINAQS